MREQESHAERRESPVFPGIVLAQAYRTVRHAMDDALRGLGLTTPQWGALECIASHAGISGAEIARLRNLTPQTVNTILQNLEHLDLVRRRHPPGNGTVLPVELTELGRERLAEANTIVDGVQGRLFAVLNPEERHQLIDLLGRCCDAFRDTPTDGCPDD